MSENLWLLAGHTVGLGIRVWRKTLRWESRNRQVLDEPCVLAVWHGRLMGVLMDQIDSGLVTMASLSPDGALAAGAVETLGMQVARGSSSRGGGEALGDMRRALADRAPLAALTVDGPRGPWRQVQPGAVVLARRLRIPIVPASFSCSRTRVLRSWDHMVLPAPFSRVVVSYGSPVPAESLREGGQAACDALAAAIDELTAGLDADVAGAPLWPAPSVRPRG